MIKKMEVQRCKQKAENVHEQPKQETFFVKYLCTQKAIEVQKDLLYYLQHSCNLK